MKMEFTQHPQMHHWSYFWFTYSHWLLSRSVWRTSVKPGEWSGVDWKESFPVWLWSSWCALDAQQARKILFQRTVTCFRQTFLSLNRYLSTQRRDIDWDCSALDRSQSINVKGTAHHEFLPVSSTIQDSKRCIPHPLAGLKCILGCLTLTILSDFRIANVAARVFWGPGRYSFLSVMMEVLWFLDNLHTCTFESQLIVCVQTVKSN